jgi:hypothetical protein
VNFVVPAKRAAASADANETVKVTFALEKAVYKKLSRLALDKEMSNRAVITEAIQDYLAKSL